MAAEESSFPDVETGPVSSETLSDAELIAATRAGDAGSFAVLYTRHVDAARACARRLVRSRSEADDLVAEGFAKVLSALRKGKGPDLAFRPYLLTAVRNSLYDRTRRDSRVEFTDETPEPVNAVLLAAEYDREDKAMVAQAYAALPERWQMVLWHTDVEGRSPAEIAPLLGISANSVAALAYRAREGLRQAYLTAHVNRGVSETCRSTTEKLSAYVRDGLSARDRRTVQDHLDGCTSCTALLAELEEANRSLKVVLLPVLAGVSAAAYLGGLSGGGITRVFRRNPTATAAGAVAAAAAVAFAAVALAGPTGGEEAQALKVPPIGSGRPTTTTTTTTLPTTTAASTSSSTTSTSSTLPPFTPPTFDTRVPPNTYVPFNPNATTVTTVRRYTTTTRPRYTTTTRPRYTTTTRPSSTTSTTLPPETATTTTTIAPTTTVPTTLAPAPPALSSTVTGLGPVYSGQSAYFSVRVANAASGNGGSARNVAVGPAEGVVVTFNLPAGAKFIGASSPDWLCEEAGTSVRCLLPRLDAGAATEAMFTLDVPSAAVVNTDFNISAVVMVNGQRTDVPSVNRKVVDGSGVTDFVVAPGADLVVAGNSLLSCPPNEPCDESPKVVAAASAANLQLGGRQVAAAFLVWQGKGGEGSSSVTFTSPQGPSAQSATVRRYAPDAATFVAVQDVTAIVQAAGSGQYSVSGLKTALDKDSYGGWSLVVVTADSTKPVRTFTLGTALGQMRKSSLPEGTSASFVLAPVGGGAMDRALTVAMMAGEGEDSLTGAEALQVGLIGGSEADVRRLASSARGAQDPNIFRSQISGVPAYSAGTDIDVLTVAVPGAWTKLTVVGTSGDDGVDLNMLAVVTDL